MKTEDIRTQCLMMALGQATLNVMPTSQIFKNAKAFERYITDGVIDANAEDVSAPSLLVESDKQ